MLYTIFTMLSYKLCSCHINENLYRYSTVITFANITLNKNQLFITVKFLEKSTYIVMYNTVYLFFN